MSLLSNQDKIDIRAALKTATDTFMVTAVAYEARGESTDRYNEDRPDQTVVPYAFNALAEYFDTDGEKLKITVNGVIDTSDIRLSINLEDLQLINAINPDFTFKGTETKDYFTCKGSRYVVTHILYDGPLDDKNILVIIHGNKKELNT